MIFIRAQACMNAEAKTCIEVGYDQSSGLVHVRDSKTPNRPGLHFSVDEWRVFLEGAKQGDFDQVLPS